MKLSRLFLVLFFCSCASASAPPIYNVPPGMDASYDVVVEATPTRVKPFDFNDVVDAIEAGFEETGMADYIVVFRVERVLKGKYTMVEKGGPSKFEQAQEAIKTHSFRKLLTLDFSNPGEKTLKQWLKVAVEDPRDTFAIRSARVPPQNRYKIYLRRLPESPDSYVMVKSVLKGNPQA